MFNLSSLMQPDKKRRKKNKKIPKSKPIVSKAKAFSKLQSINAVSMSGGDSGPFDLFATGKLYLFYLLLILRVLLVFTPQYGYIQPDEFFQSSEPIAGDVLQVETLRVWEFNQSFPIRSMFFPQLIARPTFQLLKLLIDSSLITSETRLIGYILLVGPRLLTTLASFAIDYSLYRICRLFINVNNEHSIGSHLRSSHSSGQIIDYLLIHASSYLCFTYYTHTFSNTIETILFSILLTVIFESKFNSNKNNKSSPHFQIALLMAFGFFNRPTFAVFAFVPVLYWLATFDQPDSSSSSSSSSKSNCTLLISNLGLNSLKILTYFSVVSLFLVTVDTIYHFGLESLFLPADFPDLENVWNFSLDLFEIIQKRLAFTPVNFLIYNLQSSNLARHGLHPFYFHLVVNFPLMFTLIGAFMYYDIFHLRLTNGPELRLNQDFYLEYVEVNQKEEEVIEKKQIRKILLVTLAVSMIGFSLIPHQEPRFLLPLIIPLCLLYASRLWNLVLNFRIILVAWIVINLVLVIFFGYIHQAGVVKSLFYIKSSILSHQSPDHSFLSTPSFSTTPPLQSINDSADSLNSISKSSLAVSQIDLLFCRMYLPPRHLLMIPKGQAIHQSLKIKIHDLSILEFPSSFESELNSIVQMFKNDKNSGRLILLVLPGALTKQLEQFALGRKPNLKLELISQQFPHFTFEDLSHSIALIVDRNQTNQIRPSFYSRFQQAFSMNIWKISLLSS